MIKLSNVGLSSTLRFPLRCKTKNKSFKGSDTIITSRELTFCHVILHFSRCDNIDFLELIIEILDRLCDLYLSFDEDLNNAFY